MLELYVSTDENEVDQLLYEIGIDLDKNLEINCKDINLKEGKYFLNKLDGESPRYMPMSKIILKGKYNLASIFKKFSLEGLYISFEGQNGLFSTITPKDLDIREELILNLNHIWNNPLNRWTYSKQREVHGSVFEYINKSSVQIREMIQSKL